MKHFHLPTRLFSCLLLLLLCCLRGLAQETPLRTPLRLQSTEAFNTPNSQRPGSLLVFNLITSEATGDETNTRLSLTNTHPREAAYIHLFFIEGGSGRVNDSFLCLTPSQTASFLMSDADPGVTGYLIAVATDYRSGVPVGFNHLLGHAAVKLKSGFQASLSSENFEAYFNGPLPGVAPGQTSATLALNGRIYAQAPRTVALDKLLSVADGNATMLVVNSLQGSLTAAGMAKLNELSGLVYDDAETGVSFKTLENRAQMQNIISNASTFPRLTPRLPVLIPAGRSGWLNLAVSDKPQAVTGAVLLMNPDVAKKPFAFNAGYNLQHLSYTSAVLTVPIYPPSC